MRRDDTIFLRFIAICLVLNSHLDLYYPIGHIGTGGAIGNVLFFVLSSYGLLLSEKRKPQRFFHYLGKRIKRIYPSVWFVVLFLTYPILWISSSFKFEHVLLLLSDFMIPPFWFLKGLVFYYLIGFFVIKKYSRPKIFVSMIIAFMVYLYFYLFHLDLTKWSVEGLPFKYLFYVMPFLFGIILADYHEKIKYSGIVDIVMCTGALGILYGHKILMSQNIGAHLQIIQQLILFVLIFYMIKISRSDFVLNDIMQRPPVRRIITYVSGITLELYIVHATISSTILKMNLSFPLNTIVFLVSSFIIAGFLKWAVDRISVFQIFVPSKS